MSRSNIEVDFHHFQYTFTEAELVKYGGPHFSEKEIGERLVEHMLRGIKDQYATRVTFDRRHILCANEAYPEAALSDPLADLEIWDEWQSGRRVFPYVGRFSRLGISGQEKKTSATSTMGVVGEIFAGLFAQAYIDPQLIVRVIRRWPDFIFYSGSGLYSFVESKAFDALGKAYRRELEHRVSGALLRDCMVHASRQLNADAYLKVWYAFTGVREVKPAMRFEVTFLELDVPNSLRTRQEVRILPPAVVEGVAQRAIAQAAVTLLPEEVQLFREKKAKRRRKKKPTAPGHFDDAVLDKVAAPQPRFSRETVEKKLENRAWAEVEGILANNADEIAVTTSTEALRDEVRRRIDQCLLPPPAEGERFFAAKEDAPVGTFTQLRQVGGESMYAASLSPEDDQDFAGRWSPSWDSANEPYTHVGNDQLWRCGGMAFALTDADLSYQEIPHHV